MPSFLGGSAGESFYYPKEKRDNNFMKGRKESNPGMLLRALTGQPMLRLEAGKDYYFQVDKETL